MRNPIVSRFALLLAAAAIAWLWMCPSAAAQPDPLRPEDPPIRQMVKVEPEAVQLGRMLRGERREATVVLTNISNETVMILRSFSTCGCTVPELPRGELEPGESVEVKLAYDANNENTTVTIVRIYFADELGDLAIPVHAEVEPAVVVDPPRFQHATDQLQDLNLRSADGRPFKIMGFSHDVFARHPEDASDRHRLTIDPAKMQALSSRPIYLRIFIDHPLVTSVVLRSATIDRSQEFRRLDAWAHGTGPFEDLARMVEEGVDLNATDGRGMSASLRAAMSGQTDRLRALMDFGADLHYVRPDGVDALMLAAGTPNSNADVVSLLLDAGIKVTARDQHGRSALFWAARSGDVDRVKLLIEANAAVNLHGPHQETPLQAAVKSMDYDRIKLLLEAGADPRATDASGRDALAWAKLRWMLMSEDRRPNAERVIALLEAAVR